MALELAQPHEIPGKPLHGLGVVEVATEPGTRYCGRLFAALGAHVVRVHPVQVATRLSVEEAFAHWLDEGKAEAPTLDVAVTCLRSKGAGPDVVLAGQSPEVIAWVDGLIAEHRLETLRLGLTWFGLQGSYADWRGDDALVQAMTGIAAGFGAEDGPPMLPQGRAPQLVGGATLFIAGLGVLWSRVQGQPGQRVEADVFEASLCFTETNPAAFEQVPVRPVRRGVNRFGANHPATVYPTAEGWIGVTTLTPAQWSAMAELVGHPEWSTDHRFNSSLERVNNAPILDKLLTQALATRRADDWLIEGQRRRIPLAPVPSHGELLETEHWRLRESFAPLAGTKALGPVLPFHMHADGARQQRPQETLGGSRLAGIKVVDFSMGWAGPLATRHLADLGADVVKIEGDIHYDWWRGWEAPGASHPPSYETKPAFAVMNRNKRGVTLNLTTDEGRERALSLVSTADIVIENFAPGVMEKLGISYERLSRARPGLVMVSMGAFGATGPWRSFRAYGSTVEHASGMPHANGEASWPPCLQHVAYGDAVAGLYGAIAALAALHGRAQIGGAWVDLAQVECLFQLSADVILSAQTQGPPPRMGNRAPDTAPRCVVPTAREGWLAVVAVDESSWRALCGVLGLHRWLEEPDLQTPAGRNRRGEEIEQAIAHWTSGLSSSEAASALQKAGVPAAPVLPAYALPQDPHLAARGSFVRIQRHHMGQHTMASPPYIIDGRRPEILRAAPLLGEHTHEVIDALELT